MIRGDLKVADYRAQSAAWLDDERGVRCTFSRLGDPATVTAQLDRVGCVTLTYRATPDGDPKTILVSFMDELAICEHWALTDIDGTMSVEGSAKEIAPCDCEECVAARNAVI